MLFTSAQRRVIAVGLSTAMLLVTAACDSTVAVEPSFSGTFVLVSVDGQPLPHLVPVGLTNTETVVLGDTVVFRSDGHGTWTGAAMVRDLASGTETPQPHRLTFRHSYDGDIVTANELDCGPDCLMASTVARFTRRGDALERIASLRDWRYERIGTP